MFAPAILWVLRCLTACPDGVSREGIHRYVEGMCAPERVDQALGRLLEAGVAAERDGLVVPLAGLKPLAQKMDRIASHINRKERERDLAMGLVKMVLHGP